MEKYIINNDIPKNHYKKLLKDIFEYLRKTEKDWDEEKIFIVGINEIIKSKFEKKSNNVEIGVITNSKRMGYCLLLFLRMMVDNDMKLILKIFDDDKYSGKTFKLEKIIKILEEQEKTYTNIFPKNEPIRVELITCKYGRHEEDFGKMESIKTIVKKKQNIDLWDFLRIKKKFFSKLDSKNV